MLSQALKSLLRPDKRVVVLTGAGISAESGVPTFRGKDGLWKK
ncbi:MAG TPA: Sir2 family NAD-dependent protein deacetylase, partial [Terriglobales bacterium]|nr:Sir2 family NAD-dependent protein deacetylase [Terriglobales bacterium]